MQLIVLACQVFANRAAKVVFLVSIGLLITMSFAGSLMTAGCVFQRLKADSVALTVYLTGLDGCVSLRLKVVGQCF